MSYMRVIEIPVIEFDDQNWTLAYSHEMSGVILNEYTRDDRPLTAWSELLSTMTHLSLPNQSPRNLIANTVKAIQEKIINGTLNWSILSESDEEIVYTWSISDDLVAGDQISIIRLFRGVTSLHSVHYSVRGILKDPSLYHDWTRRLRSVRLAESIRPDNPALPDASVETHKNDDEVKRIFKIVQAPSRDIDPEHYIKLCREAIALIDMNVAPDMWGIFHYLLGIFLADYNPNPSAEAIEEAIAAYRQALTVITMDAVPDLWAKTMRYMAAAFLKRSSGQPERNFEHAVAGYLQAFRVFSVDKIPLEWGSTMLSLGQAYEALGERGNREALNTAMDIYNTVVAEISLYSSFEKEERQAVSDLLVLAGGGISHIDDQLRGNPPLPPNYEPKGSAMFLRSFQISALTISNGFKGKAWSNTSHLEHLDTITLESALNAVLWPTFAIQSIGGPTDSFGTVRLFTAGGDYWQSLVRDSLEGTDIFIIVPHISEGVRWELEFLMDNDALPRCLFVMPPLSENLDLSQSWQETAEMMLQYGFHLPQYQEEGLLFRFDSNRQILETLSFETVWDNTLADHLDHLIRSPKHPA